jgi:transposase
MEDGVVRELFPSRTTIKNERYDALMCHFEQIRKAQEHPGFTFLHHYAAYSEAVADQYSYTQFMEHYNRKYKKEKGSMKLDHIPGNEIYIDFAGKKLSIVNKETGEIEALEVFVDYSGAKWVTIPEQRGSRFRYKVGHFSGVS